jgi:cytochrome c biogenesis protein CcdA
VTDLVLQWYTVMSTLTRALTEPVRTLSDTAGIAPLSAVLFGFLGALSPCQLTTGLSAFALLGRPTDGGRPLLAGVAYLGGKALVYAVLGLAFVLLGTALAQNSIPVIVAARKVLGPLMLLIGLMLLGIWRSRVSLNVGQRLASVASERLDPTRPRGAFLLGAGLSLCFCPTLFLLFFGLLIPLALASPGGVVFPALFALGTSVPLLVALAAASLGARSLRGPTLAHRVQPVLTRIAGALLVLVGLNDTVLYWVLA